MRLCMCATKQSKSEAMQHYESYSDTARRLSVKTRHLWYGFSQGNPFFLQGRPRRMCVCPSPLNEFRSRLHFARQRNTRITTHIIIVISHPHFNTQHFNFPQRFLLALTKSKKPTETRRYMKIAKGRPRNNTPHTTKTHLPSMPRAKSCSALT